MGTFPIWGIVFFLSLNLQWLHREGGLLSGEGGSPVFLACLTVREEIFWSPLAFWEGQPYLPVGDWLNALGLRWRAVKGKGVVIELPFGEVFWWGRKETKVCYRGVGWRLPPLRFSWGHLWLPVFSLTRLLGIFLGWERQSLQLQLRLGCPLQDIQIAKIPIGWLIKIRFGYPLPRPPETHTLSNPYRAYADFPGGVLTLPPGRFAEGEGVIKGFRVGQFSVTPLIARFVADAEVPIVLSVVGRQRGKDGGEVWTLLLQVVGDRKEWMGQACLLENTPTHARLEIRGWFKDALDVHNEGYRITLTTPLTPLIPLVLTDRGGEGVITSVTVEVTEMGTRLSLALKSPSWGRLSSRRDDRVILIVEPLRSAKKPIRVIVLDPGHGGKDPGALSPFRPGLSPLKEKDLTLDIAFRLRRMLEGAGYRVVMTRTRDEYVSLPERVNLANSIGADVFVSIHINAYPRIGGQWGTEVYYWTPQSRRLARCLYRNLLAFLGRKGNGVRRRMFYVIHHTRMPSALTEACYLNHPIEERLLRDEGFRERIALALYWGILEFFGDERTLRRRRD